MEIGLGDKIPFRIIYFLTHFISKNSVQVTFLGKRPYHGLLRSLWGAYNVIHNHGNTNDVIHNHQKTYPTIIRSICLPSLLFTLLTLFYCLQPPPLSITPPHVGNCEAYLLFWLQRKRNWPLVCIKHVFYVKRTYIGFFDNVYLSNKKLSEVQFEALKARYILRQIYV